MLAATANPFGARGNKKEKERKLIWLNGHWPPSSSIYWRMSRREQTYVYSGPNLNSPMKIEFFLSCNFWNKIESWKSFNFNNSPMLKICPKRALLTILYWLYLEYCNGIGCECIHLYVLEMYSKSNKCICHHAVIT